MLHEPAAKTGKDPATGYKTRLGAWMFVLYALVYGGFVAINLIEPAAMETIVGGGLNLAVVYGFGLIAFALILAVIYNALCMREEARLEGGSKSETKEGGP
jgi:uncharacterized membrane protein (DUF485 family)